jgi:glycosyltransferase involved in cell wall biosynthesis
MKDYEPLRVAIVHDWIWSMAGGERVVEAVCGMFPQADLFCLMVNRRNLEGPIAKHRIGTSFIQRLPGGVRHYKKLLPLFPLAVEQFDLRGYDLILSSDSACVKGLLKPSHALHVCYCHTPMRYAWDLYQDYLEAARPGRIQGALMRLFLHYIRLYDFSAAQRVDRFIANSHFVAKRISSTYRRDAEVVHPPVRTERFRPSMQGPGDYDLIVSRLVAYKRIDLAVSAYRGLPRRLVIIGDGPEDKRLKRIAPDNVTFLGAVKDEEVLRRMQRCRTFILPGLEDFGISVVEAQACGRPVVAFRGGGATETVVEGETGVFFDRQEAPALKDALLAADRTRWDPERIRAHALTFSEARFRDELAAVLLRALREHGFSEGGSRPG